MIVKFFLTIIVNVKGVTLYGLVKSLYTFPYSTDYIFILRCLNEHSLHIFMFLLIEGYFRTTNRWKYLGMLLLFGIISEIPYDMFTTASYFEPNGNNIMFTLALVLVIIWIIDTLKEKMGVRWRIL